MRLQEILNEVQKLENEYMDDAKTLEIIKENYQESLEDSEEIITEGMSVADAKKALKKLEKSSKKVFEYVRDKFISGFTSGAAGAKEVEKMLKQKKYTKVGIDYLKLLDAAHKGKLLTKAKGDGKKFFSKVMKLVPEAA